MDIFGCLPNRACLGYASSKGVSVNNLSSNKASVLRGLPTKVDRDVEIVRRVTVVIAAYYLVVFKIIIRLRTLFFCYL